MEGEELPPDTVPGFNQYSCKPWAAHILPSLETLRASILFRVEASSSPWSVPDGVVALCSASGSSQTTSHKLGNPTTRLFHCRSLISISFSRNCCPAAEWLRVKVRVPKALNFCCLKQQVPGTVLWLKLVRKCDLEEQQSVSQESPLGHGHGQPVHVTSTHHANPSAAAKQKGIYFL